MNILTGKLYISNDGIIEIQIKSTEFEMVIPVHGFLLDYPNSLIIVSLVASHLTHGLKILPKDKKGEFIDVIEELIDYNGDIIMI